MPIQAINTIVGIVDGSTVYETPGIILDLSTYEPLLFGVNPDTVRLTKEAVVEDHVIPGRHSPLQEPVAGGAETLQLDLLFLDRGPLGAVGIKTACQFLESLMFPDNRGIIAAASGLFTAAFLPSNITEIGHRISLTYGLWIIERPYRIRRVETETRPGKDPITLLPYSAVCRVSMQEDEIENINYTERRWGIPV
jgi:hypothetical protein